MKTIRTTVVALCAFSVALTNHLFAAAPVITSQPGSVTTATGTSVTFSVGVQGGDLPGVSSGTLKLWLKADAGVVLQNNRVTQWQDQSGGNHHCSQANTNMQPTFVAAAVNGQSAVHFDGIQTTNTGDFLQGADDLALTNGLTSFMVYSKVNRGGTLEEVPGFVGVPGNYNAARAFYFRFEEMSFSGWGNDYYSGFYVPASTYRICTERLNATKTQVDFFDTNGTNNFTTSRVTGSLVSPAAGYYVGGLGSQTRNFQGNIAELIYYQGSLSESDRQLVTDYLKQKYLPTGGVNTPGITYQWQFNSTNILNATNAALTLTNIQSANAGFYSVIVSNSSGATASSNATLTVIAPVVITAQPEGKTVAAGTNVLFTVSTTGDGVLSYHWRFNGVNIAGETNASLALNGVQATNAGNYSVNISNVISSATSSNATLTIVTAPVITTQPQDASVIAGANYSFSVGAQGSLPNVTSGTLKLWLKADAGVVLQNNRVSQWQDQSGGNHHCSQADTNMQPSLLTGAANGQPVLHFDGIQTTNTGDFLQGADDLALTNGLTSFMVYSKVSRGGALEEVPGFVGVPGNYNAARAFYFRFEEMSFSGWGNDYYSGFYVPASTYRICTERLNASKTQVDFFDTNGTNNFTTSRTTGNLISPDAGYYVGGLGSQTRNFQGNIAELIYYQGSLTETDRQSVSDYLKQKYLVTTAVIVPTVSYQWQINGTNILNATNAVLTLTNIQPSNAGLYSVVVSNAAGFVTSSNALLTVNIPPSIGTQPLTQSVNAGQTATFLITASGTGPLTYLWQKDLNNLITATNASLTLTNLQPSDAANYRVIVSSPYGVATSIVATLTVNVSTVRSLNLNASSATTVTLPVELTALGNENALGFSLVFDPTLFTFTGAALGSGLSQATLISNTNQLGSGKLGLAVGLSANATFAAGTRTIIQVNFKIAPVTNRRQVPLLSATRRQSVRFLTRQRTVSGLHFLVQPSASLLLISKAMFRPVRTEIAR